MPEFKAPFEAEIIHELPDELAALVGRVIASFAKLEHKLLMLTSLLLQLNKAETRITLRAPRAVDRLDMALDMFAIKDIQVQTDTSKLRGLVTKAASDRDVVGHGLWLKHPESDELYLRLTRGAWPKEMTGGERVSRTIYPQSIPYGPDDCRKVLASIEETLRLVDDLGAEIDTALHTYPERFRQPAPLLNPLGSRNPKGT